MINQKQQNDDPPFHREGTDIIFNTKDENKENSDQVRVREQHEFQRTQVTTNKTIAWFTGALMLATFCTIGVGVWQGMISQKSANAARDAADAAQSAAKTASGQLNLARQQMEFTQAARVRVITSIRFRRPEFPQMLWISVENDGREHATGIKTILRLVQKRIQDGRTVADYGSFPVSVPYALIPAGEQNPQGLSNDPHHFDVEWPTNIPDERLPRLWRTGDYLELTYTVSYFNGFETVSESHCLRYVTYFNPDWKNATPRESFFSCEDFSNTVEAVRKEGEYEENYKKTHP